MATPMPTPRVKPLLRGVSHEIAAALAVAACAWLVYGARAGRAATAAAIYGASLIALFSVSAFYHRVNWSPRARARMRRLDHAAIFVLIAGTYTPFCLLMGGNHGGAMLAAAWIGAGVGVGISVFWSSAPKPLAVALYLALGWMIVAALRQLGVVLGLCGFALLSAGGLLYTAGAIIYVLRRPDPAPKIFGYHEIFHALVIAAALCHFAVVSSAVAALQ